MRKVPFGLQISIGLTVAILLAVGFWFYTTQKKQYRQEIETTLEVTTKLKVEQIAAWRTERLAEATEIMERPYVSDWLAGGLKDPGPERTRSILGLFETLVRHDQYFDILLVDPSGQVHMNLGKNPGPLHPEAQSVLKQAIAEKRPLLTELHGGTAELPEHLDSIAPLIIRQGSEETVVGALVLINDVRKFLYPLLQFWPLPSKTAESLLVVHEENSASVFSHRMYSEGNGYKRQISLNETGVLAVQAGLGKEGTVYGKDYRGVDAVAAVQKVPDSSWSLVTKIDVAEGFKEWRAKSLLILGLMFGTFVLMVALGTLVWLYYRATHYQGLLQAESIYRENEARYRILFEGNPLPMWVYDKETLKFLAVNESAIQKYGYSAEEFLSMTIRDIRPPEDVSRLVEHVGHPRNRLVESGLWRHRKKNGESLFVDISIFTLEWEDRAANLVLAHDVTDRIESEAALVESEERFRAVVETAPEAIFIQTQGYFSYLNPAGAELFGVEEKSLLIGKPVIDFFHPDDRAIVSERIRILNEDRKSVPVLNERIVRIDGETVDVEALAVPFMYQGEQGALVFLRDFSERKQSEKERERLALAVEQAAEAIIICDSNGTIQYVNPAFESTTGYSPEEAIGQNPRFLKSSIQDDTFYQKMWRTITSGEVWEGRFVNRRKDGKLITEDATISPIRDRTGAIVNFIAVKRDITTQLNLEDEKQELQGQLQQAQKMEAVGRLAGGVAHDFNNMLQAIIGYTGLAIESVDKDSSTHRDLSEVLNAAQKSVDLTRQLLAFARKQPSNPKVVDINALVSGLLKMLRRLIGEDIDLLVNESKDLWKIKIDPSQIDQILANLVVNARDAIQGNGKITIETKNVTFDDDYCTTHVDFIPGEFIQLAVSDSGQGMDKETLSHVFEPFFTTKRSGEGTGLGLATVYGIVKQNGGFINVYSEAGSGTSFRIYFPHHSESPQTETPQPKGKELHGGTESILIVEDEDLILDLGVRMLTQLGYQVYTARSPEDALELVKQVGDKLDLLITDVVMPGMNGRELSQSLLEIRPGLKCLFMSGYTADVIAHRGILDSGVNFIQKPFAIETLAAKVREIMDKVET